jgi:NDP-sugar pyrophosphorylase family protein
MNTVSQLPVLVLAGGYGSRLRGLVNDRPKPMAPVAGRPFAEWLLIGLRDQGARHFVFCTGYLAEAIEKHFGDGGKWGVAVTYSQEPTPLGTAGALALAASRISSDRFFAVNGDSYCPIALPRLLALHTERRARATLWLIPIDDSSRHGSVEVGPDGQVLSFREKPSEGRSGLINAGVYAFERSVLDAIPQGRPVSLETEILPGLAGRGLHAAVGEGPFLDIGTPEAYETAEDFFVSAGLR